MKLSVFLAAAALLFWGWQTHFWPFALPMSVAVAASTFVRKRVTLTVREFARLWDVTLVFLVGAVIYNQQTLSISGAVIAFLQWLPILLFLFMAAFFFSSSARVPHSTFFFWWRGKGDGTERGLNPTYPYFAVCLLSASASGLRDSWFYPMAILLIASALALNRPRRLRPWFTLVLLVAVSCAGYVLQMRWREFQTELESRTMRWFLGFYPRQFEDQETHTSLGEIGKLKFSGRVVMRVRDANGGSPPRLYRQVSFDQYRHGTWLSTRRQYSPVSEARSATWQLAPGSNSTHAVVISASVPDGKILLPLPMGTGRVRGLASSRLERNRFGNLRVWDAPDPMECIVDYDPETSYEPPPQSKDLNLPPTDEAVVAQIIKQLGLDSLPPERVVEELDEFFRHQFRYVPFVSAPISSPTNTTSFIASFLLDTHAGHCEYFAAAGVLLLRKAGIPARYATGYAAVEPVGETHQFRIRERHAHAWVLAWIDGRWRDFDPTPSAWNSIELQHSSILRPFTDWWADMRFRWATARWFPEIDIKSALYIAFPLTALLGLALLKKRGKLHMKKQRPSVAYSCAWPGLDSEFFLVENSLEKRGLLRRTDETVAAWLLRITDRQPQFQTLVPLLNLHYRYRFDPDGLTSEERSHLATSVHAWLGRGQRA